MELEKYQQIVQENAAVLSHCLTTGTTDFSQIVFHDGHDSQQIKSLTSIISKGFDIIGCVAVGAIPSPNRTGADGYFRSVLHDDGRMIPLETKVCAISNRNIYVGARGGLSVCFSDATQSSKRKGITSHFEGKFDAGMSESTLSTKARYTALILFDSDTNDIIDAWVMAPDQVREQLNHRRAHSKNLTLKLGCFMAYGAKAPLVVPHVGWNQWCDKQRVMARSEGRTC